MPDNIAKINGKYAMAYQNEDPWHRLGTRVDTMDVHKALEVAQLDWTVSLAPLFYERGYAGSGQFENTKMRRAVIRDSDQVLLATVGNDFEPIQNRPAFEVLQPACEQLGVKIETAGALGRGDKVWMLARLPEVTEPIPGDKIEQYFLITNGFNGYTAYTARGTDVRVVCANTLALAHAGSPALVTLKHVKTPEQQLDQVAAMVTKLLNASRRRAESYAKLAAKKLDLDELCSYVENVFDINDDTPKEGVKAKQLDEVLELAEGGKGVEFAPGTLWIAFNAISEWTDHVRPAKAKSEKLIKQMNESAIFGNNMRMKERALQLALKMAA